MLITLKCLHNIPACHKPLPAKPLRFTPSWMEASGFSERGTWLVAAAPDDTDPTQSPPRCLELDGHSRHIPTAFLGSAGRRHLLAAPPHRAAGRAGKGQWGASLCSVTLSDHSCWHVFLFSSAASFRPCECLRPPTLKMGVAKGSSWPGSAETPGKCP